MSNTPPPIPNQQASQVASHHGLSGWPPTASKLSWKRRFLPLAIFLSTVATLVIVVALLAANRDPPTPVEEPEPEYANVDRLWQLYDENEVKADLVFRGKRVRVVGVVTEISTGMLGNDAVVQLVGEIAKHRARATMKRAAKASAADLKKGQQVALLCIGHSVVLGSPQLAECVVD